jgi:hypothetical protein
MKIAIPTLIIVALAILTFGITVQGRKQEIKTSLYLLINYNCIVSLFIVCFSKYLNLET